MDWLPEPDDRRRFGGGGDRRMTAACGDEQLPDVSRPTPGKASTLCFRGDDHNGEFMSTSDDVGGQSQPKSNLAFNDSTSQIASDGDADDMLWRVVSASDGRATMEATYATMSSSSMDDLCHRD